MGANSSRLTFCYKKDFSLAFKSSQSLQESVLIEGGHLGEKLENFNNDNKFEAAAGGGSICKSSTKFYTVGDSVITEDEIKALIKGSEGVYKPVEAYLLANPEACN
ncbi:hypothetical protein Gogos_003585 [Gossypium gossypioides]|uniref:Bet v I/Major latex protein domain-containing protein n=1 Tax=Gossypium gossypioides TaxID=34282 RepID=A0A7J9CNB2_GOSGO|nr:hypothetical protein [Gossypium gossypioides]